MTAIALLPPIIAEPLADDAFGALAKTFTPRYIELGEQRIDRFEADYAFVCRTSPEAATHRIINAHRKRLGYPLLMTSRVLTKTAQAWARLMADMGSVAHAYGPTEALEQIRKAGYPNAYIGQNVCAGQRAPVEAVAAWWASDGHREAMLSRHFREMGVGYWYDPDSKYQHYWCCDFGGADTPRVSRCKR
jgi:uncharacterized protein YkwD